MALSFLLLAGCGSTRAIHRSARKNVLATEALKAAHVGISIYEPSTGRWWYNHQGDKYFVPASNTKIATCYAAMKYLGDSLVSGRVAVDNQDRIWVFPAGDPTVLNSEFPYQPLLQKLKGHQKVLWSTAQWKDERWGSGWSWNDYDAAYMAERSAFPLYENLASFSLVNNRLQSVPRSLSITAPQGFGFDSASGAIPSLPFRIERTLDANRFSLQPASSRFTRTAIPLRTDAATISALLKDTLKAGVSTFAMEPDYLNSFRVQTVYSQPTDSLLKPLMHRSDNFFAEQVLLMVSNEKLGYMNNAAITDTILKTDFRDLPQKPRWVDGSGLSRYNLFTPQSLVVILQKMNNEFGMRRIREILPTGNEGTLTNYYKADSSFLFAKTGTLSGVVAISGFMTTHKGKELIFSVLVNNHQASATEVRRVVERFLQSLRKAF